MQRGKSVKIKEVIESLCKLLSELEVDFVPGTDTFRRAKFNKEDAVKDLWRLLYGLLSKAVQRECTCHATQEHDVDDQARLVRGALWQLGYGAPWLARTRGEEGERAEEEEEEEEAGSRDLLLALGWAISSGSLLESLLGERASGPQALTSLPAVPDCRPGEELSVGAGQRGRGLAGQGAGQQEGLLRRLQWEQGKLRLLWKGLQTAQAERSRLLHQVLSSTSGPTDTRPDTACTGHSKELQRLKSDIRLLEVYLEWKQMEPLFWCWMDSVIDTELAEPSPPSHRGAVAMAPKSVVVKGARCQGDTRRRGADELSETLLTLRVRLRARRAEPTGHASPSEDVMTSSEAARIQERVKLRLRGLTQAYVPRATGRRYRLCPQEHPTHRPHRPTKHGPSQAGRPGEAQASSLIEDLREEEAGLKREVERLRRGQREELQALASRLEGVVLIPPLKRRAFFIQTEK